LPAAAFEVLVVATVVVVPKLEKWLLENSTQENLKLSKISERMNKHLILLKLFFFQF